MWFYVRGIFFTLFKMIWKLPDVVLSEEDFASHYLNFMWKFFIFLWEEETLTTFVSVHMLNM